MNRRGFLTALLAAPIAAKAATLLPAIPYAVRARGLVGTVVEAGPLREFCTTARVGKGSGAVQRVYHYTRNYVIQTQGRIAKVYRYGKEVVPDGDVLTVAGNRLIARDDDLTDCQGCVPEYTFDVA